MRLRTDIFVSALVRRVFAQGDFATVEAKGAEAAGAIFVRQIFRNGQESLHAPAPQAFFDIEETGERKFETRLSNVEATAVANVLARERRFDSDLWVVSLETEAIAGLIDFADEEAEPQPADLLFR